MYFMPTGVQGQVGFASLSLFLCSDLSNVSECAQTTILEEERTLFLLDIHNKL